jgi:hypothetical protein
MLLLLVIALVLLFVVDTFVLEKCLMGVVVVIYFVEVKIQLLNFVVVVLVLV